MNLFDIGKYLGRFSSIEEKKRGKTLNILQIIKEETGISLEERQIIFSGHSVKIKNINSAVKSTIFIKKQKLLEIINEKLSIKIKDIL